MGERSSRRSSLPRLAFATLAGGGIVTLAFFLGISSVPETPATTPVEQMLWQEGPPRVLPIPLPGVTPALGVTFGEVVEVKGTMLPGIDGTGWRHASVETVAGKKLKQPVEMDVACPGLPAAGEPVRAQAYEPSERPGPKPVLVLVKMLSR